MNKYDWWFTLLNKSTRTKIDLLSKFKNTEEIWHYLRICESCIEYPDLNVINHYEKILNEKEINVVTYNDNIYPEKLKFCTDAPYVLFYKGNLKKLNLNYTVSIVGSRECTSYGKNVTYNLSKVLAENNIGVVSGMAKGIDSEAHKGVIENDGYTCAVLGCGVDIIYPKNNFNLYSNILKNGCIISEFLPGTAPYSYNFPTRNRIISALSDILIIIEAGVKSGSLITARLALDQGKEVMAVPGTIFSEQSKGTNKLIQEGAYPLLNLEDINDISGKNLIKFKESNKSLTKLELELVNIIGNNPIHMDDIIRICNIDINKLYKLLFELECKKQIMRLSGNYYVKINDIV